MTTVIPLANRGYRVFTKGASEIVLSKCSNIIGQNGVTLPFDQSDQQSVVRNVIEPMATNGLRTIAIAYKDISAAEGKSKLLIGYIIFEGTN